LGYRTTTDFISELLVTLFVQYSAAKKRSNEQQNCKI
jgi:hypothetical protein